MERLATSQEVLAVLTSDRPDTLELLNKFRLGAVTFGEQGWNLASPSIFHYLSKKSTTFGDFELVKLRNADERFSA
jgi:hypothetical protein